MESTFDATVAAREGITKRFLILVMALFAGALAAYLLAPDMKFSTGAEWWLPRRSNNYGDPIGAAFMGILDGIGMMIAMVAGFFLLAFISAMIVEGMSGNSTGMTAFAALITGALGWYGSLVYNGVRLPHGTVLVDVANEKVVYEQYYRDEYVQTGYRGLVSAEKRRDTIDVLGLKLKYTLTDAVVIAAVKGDSPRPDVKAILTEAIAPIAKSSRTERLRFVNYNRSDIGTRICQRIAGTCPFSRLSKASDDYGSRDVEATPHWTAKHTLDEVIAEKYAAGAFEFLLNAKAGARTPELLAIVMNEEASQQHLEVWTRAPGLTDAQRRSIRDKLVASSDATYFATAALKRQLVDADRTLMKKILMENGSVLSVLDLDAGTFSFNDEEKRQKVENVLDTSSPRTLSILISRHGQYIDPARRASVYEKIAALGSDGDVFRAFVSLSAGESGKESLFTRLLAITDERYINDMQREHASLTDDQWRQWSEMIVSRVTDIAKLRSLVMRLNLGTTVIGLPERVQEIVAQNEKELLLSLELLYLEKVLYVPAGYTLKTTMKLIDAGKLKKNECLRMLSDLRYRNINKIESVKTALEGCPE